MYTKNSLFALCAAAAVKEVSAAHGHQHLHPNRRDLEWAATETVVFTDWVTVTVTGGEDVTAAAAPTSSKKHHHHHHSAVTTTSSSSSTIETSSAEPSTSAEPTVAPPAPPAPSTSITSSSTSIPPPPPPTTTSTPVVVPTTMVTSTSVAPPADDPTIIPPVSIPETTSAAPSTTSTSTPPVPTPTSAPSPSGGKIGLAYTDASLVQEFVSLGGQITWAYNWGTNTGGDLPPGVAYYPMLWGTDPNHADSFPAAAEQAISEGNACLLAFNEPDISSQANMAPDVAAKAFQDWLNQYAGKALVSAPAISSSQNAGQGLDWLSQFFDHCGGQCSFDFCVGHWYGPGGDDGAAEFLQYATDLHTACDNKPVWITEFQATSGDVDQFLKTVISQLDSDAYSFVEKYSYFMANVGAGYLFDTSTALSSLGQIYAGLV